MSFLSRLFTRNQPVEAEAPGVPAVPETETASSLPAAPAAEDPFPAPVEEPVAQALAEDEALAEAVLRSVERHQAGRAIQEAARIARQFQGTNAVLPLMTALRRLSEAGGTPWKDSERASVEKAIGEAIRVARASVDHLDWLAELSKDPSPTVRRYAMWKLGDLGDVATEALVEGLRDPDDTVRIWTAEALGPTSARDLRRARPLIAALEDRRSLVRARAATALARLLVRATTGAGYGNTVAPSAELVADAMAALGRALDEERARQDGPGLVEAGEAGIAARDIAEAVRHISEAKP
jgi:HEAT repeat protein